MKITGQQPPEFHGIKGGTAKENQKSAGHPGSTRESAELPVKTSTFVMNKIKGRISTEPEVRAVQRKFDLLFYSSQMSKS